MRIGAHVKLVELSRYLAYAHGSVLQHGIFVQEIGSDYRELRRKLATGIQKLQINKKSRANTQIYLQVPPTVPSFNTCPIISVEYFVEAPVKLVELSRYLAYAHGSVLQHGIFVQEIGSDYRELRRKLATGIQKLQINKKSRANTQIYLQVPPTVPSFNTCPIISVEYFVEIKFETSGALNSDVEATYPIIVGTIPVRAPVSVPLVQPSAPPMDFPSTSTPVSPSVPSAPPMDSPPPYSGSSDASMYPPAPPSYEESVQGAQGTTMDVENMEAFVPRYPFYPTLSNSSEMKNGVL
ncbi:arrestin domain protein [Oesophagostomum dentatum]|uniref:Arrestin domain protein n=1 Tax=Oesophagostomum dentatum TaxID=61180 RepID=A0A0B1TI05_OESDE|nr:arrestin domain protein [Oesophagostomum dentatum]